MLLFKLCNCVVSVEDFDTESEMGDDRVSLRSFQSTGGMSEEDAARYKRKQEKIAIRRHKEQEMKRLRMAQEIQRHLEEVKLIKRPVVRFRSHITLFSQIYFVICALQVEIKQREVEMRGVAIERALRGEGPGKNLLF